MGGGTYSSVSRNIRATALGYDTKSVNEIFVGKAMNNAMNPYGIKVRESCDSPEHPNSKAILLGLDVTGSMGSVPHFLVKEGLPMIMDNIIKHGIKDPQVLFVAIGDHTCDQAPLQVGQFESSDELLDKWLTTVWLEGHGGGNEGESYLLAWYFAGYHTRIDCFDKRKEKGILITIGDEPILPDVPASFLKKLMGEGQYDNFSAETLLEKAMKTYDVYHINIQETSSGSRTNVITASWGQLLKDRLIMAKHREDVANIISGLVTNKVGKQETTKPATGKPVEEMML